MCMPQNQHNQLHSRLLIDSLNKSVHNCLTSVKYASSLFVKGSFKLLFFVYDLFFNVRPFKIKI